jgi:hypothetical protein
VPPSRPKNRPFASLVRVGLTASWGLAVACKDDVAPTPEPLPGWILVADTGHGRVHLRVRDPGPASAEPGGSALGDLCFAELFPEACSARALADDDATCLLFGADLVAGDDDSDTLSLTWGRRAARERGIPGGLLTVQIDDNGPQVVTNTGQLAYPDDPTQDGACRIDPASDTDCSFQMPHARLALPDGREAVADTLNNRVVIVGSGGEDDHAPVWGLLTSTMSGAWWPNALARLDADTILVTYKGSDPVTAGSVNLGRILAWDLQGDVPAVRWRWPEEGALAAVHGGSVQVDRQGRTWLIYGHAHGASDRASDGPDGSVGLALFDDPSLPPRYVADLVLDGDHPLGFVRAAQLVDDDAHLLVTDSGCENATDDCTREGQVLSLDLAALGGLDGLLAQADGRTGAWSADHAEQVLVPTPRVGALTVGPLAFPFVAHWLPEDAAPWLAARGACPRE